MSPISSSAYGRLFIFILLVLLSSVVLLGIVPLIMLIFGLLMADRKRDSGYIGFASRVIDGYAQLVFALSFVTTAYYIYEYANHEYSYYHGSDVEQILTFGIITVGALAMMVAQKYLFLQPLVAHSDWIDSHGVFRSKARPKTAKSNAPSRLQVRKYRTGQSVADELMKWGKLRDDGHISDAEFFEMKDQLLQRR